MRPLLSNGLPDNGPIEIPVAQRELVNISGISKAGNFADVEFIWRWVSSIRWAQHFTTAESTTVRQWVFATTMTAGA